MAATSCGPVPQRQKARKVITPPLPRRVSNTDMAVLTHPRLCLILAGCLQLGVQARNICRRGLTHMHNLRLMSGAVSYANSARDMGELM